MPVTHVSHRVEQRLSKMGHLRRCEKQLNCTPRLVPATISIFEAQGDRLIGCYCAITANHGLQNRIARAVFDPIFEQSSFLSKTGERSSLIARLDSCFVGRFP
jgi:ribosomal protein L34E